MQEPRAVRAGVLAKEQQHVAFVEIRQDAGADRAADDLLQPDAGGLVAHVGAVGQVVVPVKPGEQRVQERCLKAGAARGVKDRGPGRQAPQRRADGGEGLVPGGFHIAVAGGVIAHRMGQPALRLKRVIGPAAQFGQWVRGKEIRAAAVLGQVPDGGLGAVLAEFGQMRRGGLGPGAGGAHVPARLVLAPQRVQHAQRHPLAPQVAQDAADRTPAAGRVVVIGSGRVLFALRAVVFGHRSSCNPWIGQPFASARKWAE